MPRGRKGRVVIANFRGPDDGYDPLQRLDPATGEVETLLGEIEGRRLRLRRVRQPLAHVRDGKHGGGDRA